MEILFIFLLLAGIGMCVDQQRMTGWGVFTLAASTIVFMLIITSYTTVPTIIKRKTISKDLEIGSVKVQCLKPVELIEIRNIYPLGTQFKDRTEYHINPNPTLEGLN